LLLTGSPAPTLTYWPGQGAVGACRLSRAWSRPSPRGQLMELADAYRRCEEITRAEARNFSYGIRLLPSGKRQAMSALYALARRMDDIGDGDAPPGAKLAALATVRKELAALNVESDDPVLAAVADTAERYPVPMAAFDELVDGCEMDVQGARYRTFDELVGYC